MEAKDNNHIRLTEGVNRRLGYAQEFKDMIHEHPGILRTALRLTQEAEDEYNPPNIRVEPAELQWNKEKTEFEVIKHGDRTLEEPMPYGEFIAGRGVILVAGETLKDPKTGLEVTALAKRNLDASRRKEITTYFKITLEDKSFFIKKSVATMFPGYKEFKNSIKAKKFLSGLKDLQIIEAQLGYTDSHQSWFVSKWQDLESEGFFPYEALWGYSNPNDYGEFPEEQEVDSFHLNLVEKVQSTIKQIETRSTEAGIHIFDLEANLFVNPKTGKLFFLDVTEFRIWDGTDSLNQ